MHRGARKHAHVNPGERNEKGHLNLKRVKQKATLLIMFSYVLMNINNIMEIKKSDQSKEEFQINLSLNS